MYRFAPPADPESTSPEGSGPRPTCPALARSKAAQSEVVTGEGKPAVPTPLPLPAAPIRESLRKRRQAFAKGSMMHVPEAASDAGSPASGQLFADKLDLGPEYPFYDSRTATASVPLPSEAEAPEPKPPNLLRVRTMPFLVSAANKHPVEPSGLPAISTQELNVSDEETAALVAAAAAASDFARRNADQKKLAATWELPATAASHPTSVAASRHQDALEHSQPLEHLPKLEEGSTDPTAFPNWHVLADREVELARLNSGDRLDAVLADPGASESLREVKEQTRRLRRNVGRAMEQGHTYKGFVRIKPQKKNNKLLGKATKSSKAEEYRHAVLHLTPLKSAEGKVTHFAAIFG